MKNNNTNIVKDLKNLLDDYMTEASSRFIFTTIYFQKSSVGSMIYCLEVKIESELKVD